MSHDQREQAMRFEDRVRPGSAARFFLPAATLAAFCTFGTLKVEAAETLDISRVTLYGFIRDGRIRSFKLGRRRLITPRALDEFVERAERGEVM